MILVTLLRKYTLHSFIVWYVAGVIDTLIVLGIISGVVKWLT